jgi:hypothetical protein
MTTEHPEQQSPAGPAVAVSDDQLVAMLVDRARGDGMEMTGEGGLLQQLTKRVLESALEGEMAVTAQRDRSSTSVTITRFERMHYVCFHHELDYDPVDPDNDSNQRLDRPHSFLEANG